MAQEQKIKLAVVRVRSSTRTNKDIVDTLKMLNLHNQNYCVIVESTPSILGMLRKAKDYITWGIASDEVIKLLDQKRSIVNGRDKKEKLPFYRLAPPLKGFGRKGIKKSFVIGGALGNRKDKINDLIKRMI